MRDHEIDEILGLPHGAGVLEGRPVGGASEGQPYAPALRPAVSVSTTEPSAIVGGAYEGAQAFDRMLATWFPPIRSADADLLVEKPLADARSRDITRNDAHVQSAVNIRKNSIVGDYFMLSAKPDTRILGKKHDQKWAEEFQEEVEAKFWAWAEGTLKFWCDAGGKMTFTDMIRLAVGIDAIGGETLTSVEWIRDRDQRRAWNTAINFVDADRLSNPEGRWNEKNLRNGVERDDFGTPLAYHIRNGHPADTWNTTEDFYWTRVAARKPWGRKMVLHYFDPWRADQSRGISSMVACLKEMRVTKRFRELTLQKAAVAATFAATIESELPMRDLATALGGDGKATSLGSAFGTLNDSYLASIARYAGATKNGFRLDGVKIPHLYPGTKLNIRPAGSSDGVGTDFEDSVLRYLASGLDVDYHEFSNNYEDSNYSSIKASLAKSKRAARVAKRRHADRMANDIYSLFLEEGINKGLFDSMPRNPASFYEGLNAEAYTKADWIGATAGQIDELKESQASGLRMDQGVSTLEIECAKLGLDWRQVVRQREREKKALQKADLWEDQQAATERQNRNVKNGAAGGTRDQDKKGNGSGDDD